MPESLSPDLRGSPRVAPGGRQRGVQIIDTPTLRLHRPGDLIAAIAAALGVALVMLLAVYAHGTTTGVEQDVRGFTTLLRQGLSFPVTVLEGLVTLFAPIAVLSELAVHRLGRQVLEVISAAVLALAATTLTVSVIEAFGSPELVRGLSVASGDGWTLSVPVSLAAVTGLLTTAGPRSRRRMVRWSWSLLGVSVAIILITGEVSLPGTAVALLLGRLSGLTVRFVSGVRSERADGAALVDAIVRAGFSPARLVRVDNEPPAGVEDTRRYDMIATDGTALAVVVLDADRHVLGSLARMWRAIRLRGVEGRSFVSLRQATERTALLTYSARAAGVRTPPLLGVAEAGDSMLLVQGVPGRAVPLGDLPTERLTDEVLHGIWEQVRLLHEAGIAHRTLTSATVLVEDVDGRPEVWLTGWESGDVAAAELARRMDIAQLVAMLATRVGATRALESASGVLPASDVAAIGPLLQTVVLPRRTREEVRLHREVLTDLRTELVAHMPEADVEPVPLVRFGARTLVTVILPVVAAIVILTTVNVNEITTALSTSDWRWTVVSFVLGMATFVGAGLAFVAFAPVRISVWAATLVHAVGAFVGLVTPAGVGSAALNMRMLTKRGVTVSLAVATVALVQVSQFVVTVALLLILSLLSGTRDATQFTPTSGTLVTIAVAVAAIAVSLLFPAVRVWVVRTTMPTLRQTWPRLIEVLGHPGRVAVALTGNVMLTMGYILAFDASLLAFGQHLSLVQVALIFLIGNTAGAIVPTPGGLGTIEVAFIGGLTAAGLNPGIAASVTILFRVLTYWVPIPIGWLALQRLQHTGDL